MKREFVVYQIVKASFHGLGRVLVEKTKTDTLEEAVDVIKMYGKELQDYTILEVYSL